MVAVDLSICTLVAARFSKCYLILKSDNSGVVGALAAGRSQNAQQNAILRRIVDIFQSHSLWVSIVWVPSESNKADAPSWGIFPARKQLFPFPPRMPSYLTPFVQCSVEHRVLVD